VAIDIDSGLAARRDADERLAAIARRFGDALRGGDGRGAEGIAREALSGGMSLAGTYARVVAPAMHWIGQLWARGAITVAEEHLAAAIAHRVIAALYMSNAVAATGAEATVVLAAPACEHHGLGLRMAADVLETGGFRVVYLGTDVPVEALHATAAARQPAVVGLSLTMAQDAAAAAQAAAAVNRASPETHVLFGGQGVPRRWIDEGVNYAASVETLVAEVRRLTTSRDAAQFRPAPSPCDPLINRDHAVEVGTIEGHMLEAAIEMGQLLRDQARLTAHFQALAFQDHLCGLPNGRAFDDRFTHLAASATASDLALMLLDVDRFKDINDRFGHDTGDQALQLVAEGLREGLRASDLPARLGGDEFAALVPAITPPDARALAADLQRRITDRCRDTHLTVSIGVAWFTGGRRRTMLAADHALYEAKSQGGNQVCVIEPATACTSLPMVPHTSKSTHAGPTPRGR
jgi:diguanylate cyclase (GGDEF)-like protein